MPTRDEISSRIEEKKTPLIWLYPITALLMLGSSFNHIFTQEGINAFGFDDIIDAWPVLLLWISVVLFLFGFVTVFRDVRSAYKIGAYSSVIGWIYYFLTGCSLFLYISVFAFLLPERIITFDLPVLLLLITTIQIWRNRKQLRVGN